MRDLLPRVTNDYKAHLTRRFIYRDGYVVNSTAVETILQPSSSVPTVVSFIE